MFNNKKKKKNEEIITNTNDESGLILGVPETLDEIETESVMDLNDIPDEELRGDIPAELLDWSGEISSGKKRLSEQKKDDQKDPVLTKQSKETQSFIEYLKSNGKREKSVHSEEHGENHSDESKNDNKNEADENKAAREESVNKDENVVNEKQEDESVIQVSKEGTDAGKSEEIKETRKQPVDSTSLSKSTAECTESDPDQKNVLKDKIKNIEAENTNKKEQSQGKSDGTEHPCDYDCSSPDDFDADARNAKYVEESEKKRKIENPITDSKEDPASDILEGNRTEEIPKEEGCEHQEESDAKSDTSGGKGTLNTEDTETEKKDCDKEVSDDRHTEEEMYVADISEKKEMPEDDKVVSDVNSVSDCNTEINAKSDISDKINSEEAGKTLDLNEESKELSKDIDPMRNISVADTETGNVWRTKNKNKKKKNKRKETVRIDKQNVTGDKTYEAASIILEHDGKNIDELDIQQSSVPKETLEKAKEDLKDENCKKIQDEEIKEPAKQEVVTDKENTAAVPLADKDNNDEISIKSAPEEILSDKKSTEVSNTEIIESKSSDQEDAAEIKSSHPADNKNERMEDDVKLPFQNSIFRLFKKKEQESDNEEKSLNDSSSDKLIILTSEEETASHTNYGGQQLKSTEEILASPRINTNDIKERMKKMDQTQYPRQNTEGVVNQDYDFNDEYPENTRTEPVQQPEYYEEEMNQQDYSQQTQTQQPIYPRQNPQMRAPRQGRPETSPRMPQNGEESMQQPMPNYPKQNMPQTQRPAFNPQQNMPQGPHNGQPQQMNGGYPRANQNTVKRERQNTRKPNQPMPNPNQTPVQNMPQQDILQRNPQNTQPAPQQSRPKTENYNRGERKMQGIYGGKPKPQSQPQNFDQPNQSVPSENPDSLIRETPINEQPRSRKSNISEQRPHAEATQKKENRQTAREKCEQQFLPPTNVNQHVFNMSECDDPSKMFNNEMSQVKTIVRTVSNHDAFDEQVAYWLDHGFRIHDTKVIMPQITNQEAMLFALMIKGGSNS